MERQPLRKTEYQNANEMPEDGELLQALVSPDSLKSHDFSANRREYRAQMRHQAAEQLRLMELRAQSEAEAAATQAESEAIAAHAEADAASVKLAAGRAILAAGLMKAPAIAANLQAEEQAETMRRSSLRKAAEYARRAAAQASAFRQAAQHVEAELRSRQRGVTQAVDSEGVIGPIPGPSSTQPSQVGQSATAKGGIMLTQPANEIGRSAWRDFERRHRPLPTPERPSRTTGRSAGRADAGVPDAMQERKTAPIAESNTVETKGRRVVTATSKEEFLRDGSGSFHVPEIVKRISSSAAGESGWRVAEKLIGPLPIVSQNEMLFHGSAEDLTKTVPGSRRDSADRSPRKISGQKIQSSASAISPPEMPPRAGEGAAPQQSDLHVKVTQPKVDGVSAVRSGEGVSTLRRSQEQVSSRWFGLHGILSKSDRGDRIDRQATFGNEWNTPFVVVYSLAGGVGKTSLVATLGRALSSLGEKVVLTDTSSQGLLPFYFGASEFYSGVVRTFSPPSGSTETPIHLVSYDFASRERDRARNEGDTQGEIFDDLVANSQRANRVLMDLSVNCRWMVGRMAWMRPTILVPLAADMNSVISLPAVERSFSGLQDSAGNVLQPIYLLNQFDASLPLHLDVREVLKRKLGERLLPFVLRRASSVTEALAEGMTIFDYEPESGVASDYMRVASWLHNASAPVTVSFRKLRWSET